MDVFYQKQFEKALTTAFDNQLAAIKNLTWLPWVGKHYTDCRIMIVAESHYTNTPDCIQYEKDLKDYMSNPLSTREVLAEYPMLGYDAGWKNNGGRSNNPTFDNIFKLLISDDLLSDREPHSRRVKLCSNFAFMNMIQRPMWYPSNRPKERPTDADRSVGWDVIIEVLKILLPDICIFAGSDASRFFEQQMKRVNVPYENWKYEDDRIGNTFPKSATVTIEGKKIPFKFIRHPGSYFNWEKWQEFVFSDCKSIQEKLLRIMQS